MVKGFDLTKNDPSKLVLDYLFGYFEASRKLAIEEAHEYILHWLKTENSTSKIYKMFKQ